MSRQTCWHRVLWLLATALILVVFLSLISPLPAAAQSIADYFQLSYDPVSFSQNEIHGSEIFSVTILGRATCTKDLPAPVSEASITSRVIAEHTVSGSRIGVASVLVTVGQELNSASAIERMPEKLRTEEDKKVYGKRKKIAEPVF